MWGRVEAFFLKRYPIAVPYDNHQEEIVIHYYTPSSLHSLTEPCHEITNNVVCATSKGSDQPAHTCSLIRTFTSRLNIL